MHRQRTIIERAYDLAGEGGYADIAGIRRKLKAEGYDQVDGHISGSVAVARRKLMAGAKAG